MPVEVFDILVIGGGPAGVTAAMALAEHGYRIALLTKPCRLPALEGLGERTLNGLGFAGCRQALAQSGPEVIRQAHWNGAYFAGNRERLVERSAFDAALQEDAREAGIAVSRERVTGVQRQPTQW